MLSNSRWRERWCRVRDNKLVFHKDRADLKTHIASIPLRGCEVIPGLDSKHPLTFRLLRNGQEVAVLEVGRTPARSQRRLLSECLALCWRYRVWIHGLFSHFAHLVLLCFSSSVTPSF